VAQTRIPTKVLKTRAKTSPAALSLSENLKTSSMLPPDFQRENRDLNYIMEVVLEVIHKLERLGFIVGPASGGQGPDVEAKILSQIKLGDGRFTPKEISARLGFKSKKPVIERLKRLAKDELVVYQWCWPAKNARWNLGKNQRPTLTREGRLVANNSDKLDGKWLEVLEKEGFYELRKKYGF